MTDHDFDFQECFWEELFGEQSYVAWRGSSPTLRDAVEPPATVTFLDHDEQPVELRLYRDVRTGLRRWEYEGDMDMQLIVLIEPAHLQKPVTPRG